jgi:hypothetical protein
MGRECSAYGERGSVYRVLVGKPEGKRILGRTRHRWEGNIRWIFRKWYVEGKNWIELAPKLDKSRAIVNAAMNLRVR